MEKINLITPEDMATFDRIDRDCLKMHVCPPPKTFINMKVHDANGNLTLDMDMPSRSWVRNAYNMMAHLFLEGYQNSGGTTYGAGTLSTKNISGTTDSSAYKTRAYYQNVYDAGGTHYRGILVGSGTGAESLDSYALGAVIQHGTSEGNLSYADTISKTLSYSSESKKWTLVMARSFNNNSGGSIDVKECGLSINAENDVNTNASSFLIARDLLPSPVTVSNAAQLTVTYTIEMTFPG